MIPRVARSGQSFDGAGLYYLNDKLDGADRERRDDAKRAFTDAGDYALHDKGVHQTAYRVGFTAILNMDAESPAQAIDQMSASFDRYREKEANKRGRKLTKPVYVYSLAWAPDQAPDREEMMAAARSSIKALRLDGLQTLIVQHTDEPHPHIHVIVNRIERDGSRARNIAFDQLRFSRWAEEYERQNGGIRCEQRVRNNELRRQGVMVRDTVSLTRAEYTARERAQHAQLGHWRQEQDAFRKDTQRAQKEELWGRHDRERQDLEARTNRRIGADTKGTKEQFLPKWRALYTHQQTEKRAMAHATKGGIFERAVFVFLHKKSLSKDKPLRLRDIAMLCLSGKALRKRLVRVHTLERAELSSWERTLIQGAVRNAWRAHGHDFNGLRARQEIERERLLKNHQQEWRSITKDRDAEAREKSSAHEREADKIAPSRKAPELRPGNAMAPGEVARMLDDERSLGRTFERAAKPSATKPEHERKAEAARIMKRYIRKKHSRDFDHER